jgi:exodeoxyribonuclease V alpha subunit
VLSRQTTICQKLQESITARPNAGENHESIVPKSAEGENSTDGLSYEDLFIQEDPMIGMENVSPYDFMLND